MYAHLATLVLVGLCFSAVTATELEAVGEIGHGDDHGIKTKRDLLLVKEEEVDLSADSGSEEEVVEVTKLKRSIQDDLHRPINDDTDSLGPLVEKLHRKRCARTTAAPATTTTAAAAG